MNTPPEPNADQDTKAILARRRLLILSALGGLGIAATAVLTRCDTPQTAPIDSEAKLDAIISRSHSDPYPDECLSMLPHLRE